MPILQASLEVVRDESLPSHRTGRHAGAAPPGHGAVPLGRDGIPSWIRLYTLDELRGILTERGLVVQREYGGYDTSVQPSENAFLLVVHSVKPNVEVTQ